MPSRACSSTNPISRRWWPQLRAACPGRRHTGSKSATAYEELLARDRIARPDLFAHDETAIAELFYTSGSHRHAQRRDALAPHAVPACASPWPPASFITTIQRGTAHHPAVPRQRLGARPQSPPCAALSRSWCAASNPPHVFRLIQEEKATGMSLVPTMANALLNCPEPRQASTFPACARSTSAARPLRRS